MRVESLYADPVVADFPLQSEAMPRPAMVQRAERQRLIVCVGIGDSHDTSCLSFS